MKILGIQLSPFARKVGVVLTIKGLPYEQEPVLPGNDDPEFHALSPLGKIPVLLDGDLVLPDSSVICEYLEEKYPDPTVMPATPEDRARARFLEEYADTKLVQTSSTVFVQNFAGPRFFNQEPDDEKVRVAVEEEIPPVLDYLESRLPGEGFLFGDLMTADISLVSPIFNAMYGGYSVDAGRWPKYAAYIERVTKHPAVAKVRELEAQVLKAMLG